jgi:hypothetical protein
MKKLLLFGALLFWLNGLIAQTNFIHQDSIFTRTATCDAGVAVCIDSFTYDSITNLRFYLDGRQFSGTFTACTIDTAHSYGYADIFKAGVFVDRGGSIRGWSVVVFLQVHLRAFLFWLTQCVFGTPQVIGVWMSPRM